jgi:hypothetical protein
MSIAVNHLFPCRFLAGICRPEGPLFAQAATVWNAVTQFARKIDPSRGTTIESSTMVVSDEVAAKRAAYAAYTAGFAAPDVEFAIRELAAPMNGVKLGNCEFLAKRLMALRTRSGQPLTLATPMYVALMD